jgi:hypothetical protein
MSHLVRVKEPNMSVPGRGVVPDEQLLLIDQRQMDRFQKGPQFTAGKLAYEGPGLLTAPVANLNTGLGAGTITLATLMNFSGVATAIGIVHTPAPVSTGLNITLGVAVASTATPYVAPATSARATFVAAGYNAVANWKPITPVKFRKGQYVLIEAVTSGTAFTSGAGTIVVALQDPQNAYSAYS